MVKRFEHLLAEELDVEDDRVVTTTSGTTALHLALAALGIGPGDEVIVPDLTYIATVNAVKYVGATPVLVDVDPRTWCIDPERVAEAMTARTKAILPVHLYGQSCDMDALAEIARDWHGVPIVEDAAEGFCGTYHGRPFGTLGVIGCLSFFGNKLITTGEGGACVASTSTMAAKLRSLACMCNDPDRRYHHLGVGFNFRMSDLQAAVGIPQVEDLARTTRRRYQLFLRYRANLGRATILPTPMPNTVFAPWLFTCELPKHVNRDRVMAELAGDGIETRPTFVPMHEMFGAPDWDDFPNTNRISQQGISLPTYIDLTDADVDRICDALLFAMEMPC
jgi:perosamine synthetase